VGANYLAGREFPPNRINTRSVNDCESSIREGVEKRILRRDRYWGIKDFCKYEYERNFVGQKKISKYSQDFTITEKSIEKIVDVLTEKAVEIQTQPFTSTESTIELILLTTTSLGLVEVGEGMETTSSLREDASSREKSPQVLGFIIKTLLVILAVVFVVFFIRNRKSRSLYP